MEVIKCMTQKMQEKFDKYWEDINGLLAVVSILDPRNKMDCIKFYFDLFYDGEAEVQIERIRKLLDMLVNEYQENKNEDYELLSQISKIGYLCNLLIVDGIYGRKIKLLRLAQRKWIQSLKGIII